MKKDVTELKKMFVDILKNPGNASAAMSFQHEALLHDFSPAEFAVSTNGNPSPIPTGTQPLLLKHDDIHAHEEVEESLNIMDKEKELIVKALKKHKGKRKDASMDLGISERTLYRKLKEYDIDE
jgi:DNA-binding NtrC family response regulator